MINIVIFSCICLTAALFTMGFMCYHLVKLGQSLKKLHFKSTQNDLLVQLIHTRFTDLDTTFKEQVETLKTVPQAHSSSAGLTSRELIEQNYERAKSLLKRGLPLDRDLMQSCNITEEEFELLGD